ncbi:kinase domain-containing protein [Mactra antiquata]
MKTTTEYATFDIDFLASTNIPLATVNGTIDFKNGSTPTSFVNDMQHTIPLTLPQTYTVIYPVQGYYNVTLLLENPVDSVLLWKYMEIWDRLDTVVLTCHTNCSILVTNTSTVVEFTGVPVSGFEYSIDMDDGTIYQNANDSILYSPYALVSTIIELFAIYTLNGYTFVVDNTMKTTTEYATFDIDFLASTNIPLATVNGTIDFKNGSTPTSFVNDMQHTIPLTLPQTYTVIYPVQGYYNVTLLLENPVDSVLLWKYMEIWDRLDTVVLTCHTNCSILVTNTSTVVEFIGVPVSGFEYSIDMDDGTIYQNANDSILYSPYALGNFTHTYSSPGYYNLQWNVWNYGHNNSDSQWVTVQNLVTNFQAWLNHGDIYIVINTAYNFQASADMGTNVTISWDFATTKTDFFIGEFTSTSFMHTFTSPQTNVTVTASNLVNSVSTIIELFAIYTLNGYTFVVDNTMKTTTEYATFDIDFLASTNIPLATVNGTIDFKNGSTPTSFVNDMQHTIPLTLPQTYTAIYPVQGYYNVTLLLENPVDSVLLWKYMEIWDRLDTVVLTCHTNCSILVTNTSTVVEFIGVPVSGFEYSIDMGDGTIYQNANDSILYSPYALGNFTHIYSSPGYYYLQWNVWNYGYNNSGSRWVTVQNIITDFQV